MKFGRNPLLLLIAGLLVSGSNLAATDIVTFVDTGDKVTKEFEVKGPWLLNWSLATDYPKHARVHIALLDAITGLHAGEVVSKKRNFVQERRSGLILFESSGRFQFRVDANLARWVLQVQELTDEEALELKPARQKVSTDWIR